MAGIFPPTGQGGVPPGPNVVNGYTPANAVLGEGPLYVSAVCTTILTDSQINAFTSEFLATVDKLGISWDASKLTNVGDALVSRFNSMEGNFVNIAGDTMTGPLTLFGPPTAPLHAATKQSVDAGIATLYTQLHNEYIAGDDAIKEEFRAADAALQNDVINKVSRTGDTMSGPLILSGEPTTALQAATKSYVDSAGGGGGGGITDAPYDGLAWARKDNTWIHVSDVAVMLAGGTMTGPLTLSAAVPITDLQAAPKSYVDLILSQVLASTGAAAQYTAKTDTQVAGFPGDGKIAWNTAPQSNATVIYVAAMTADNIDLSAVWARVNVGYKLRLTHKTDQTRYADYNVSAASTKSTVGGVWFSVPVTAVASTGLPFGADQLIVNISGASGTQYLPTAGGTMLGPIVLSGAPTISLHPATKAYVDAANIGKVAKAGDTMTGPLALPGNPANALEAAPKQYVDIISTAKVSRTGDTMTGPLTLPGDPANDLHAATKAYVDAHAGTGGLPDAPSDGNYYTRRNAAWASWGATIWTARALIAGAGLTGGGDLSADRTFAVGAGTGITVNADDVALTVPVQVIHGGTGATTQAGAKTNLGLSNVDNTADASKPISSATQAALNAKLAIASNLSDVNNTATAFTNIKQAASTTATGVIELSTDAEVRSATGSVAVVASQIESASALVGITDAATLAVDWDAGINFVTTIAGNRVVGNPTNGQVGTYRTFYISGNDATARTITWSSFFKGDIPVITDCSSAKQYLFTMFCVNPASHFIVTVVRAL
jgi:hypothetical protein